MPQAQTRVHRVSRREEMAELTDEDVKATSQVDSEEAALLAETERILDEIDEALGAEIHFAEAFWAGFVQKGGQ